MNPPVCIGEPVSWLRLERYHLLELPDAETASVEAHLVACPACAACLDRIKADDATALPPFELPQRRGASPALARAQARWFPRSRVGQVGSLVGALAVAAAAMLAIGRPWMPGGPLVGAYESASVKGGDVSFTLVRDDGTKLMEESGAFHDGDRFKVLVTCPPMLRGVFDVVVFDATGASFPLASAEPITCGNEVPIHGAFRLTGASDERICVVWSEGEASAPDRGHVAAGGPESDRRCKELRAAPAVP